jgi:hypothetical protein
MTRIQDGYRDADSGYPKVTMYGKDRNLLIDCLRGFSILIVVGTHGALTAQGYFGVSIFFVISGRMRAARILPCLLSFLLTLLFWIGVEGFVPARPSLISSGIFNG